MQNETFDIEIHSPAAAAVWLLVDVDDGEPQRVDMNSDGPTWRASVPVGSRYAVHVAGAAVDESFGLVDPFATQVWFPADHDRDHARPRVGPAPARTGPKAEAVPWPERRPQRPTTRPHVVYETHVKGLTATRPGSTAGKIAALAAELPRLADLGVSVVELLPMHQFDPDEGNYWGYMPLVFGAIHRQYASGDRPADELAAMVDAAHNHDIEVWLDVVVNHTTEEGHDGPIYSLRGLAAHDYYVIEPDGMYVNDAGCGNIIDATSAPAQRLIMSSLDRLADLGIDGFRFDLTAVLTRDADFVRSIGDWAVERGVRLVAEPWDLRRYLIGRNFPDDRWAQWNGQFRDDMRSFLRGEGGLVAAVIQRVQGSPDLFDAPLSSVNFLTAHDGFTMYDLVAYERKRNEANGWNNTDGSDDNRSWNCGWEGDDGVPADVAALRRRQMRNAMAILALSHGVPMFVAGDEFARTQSGNNNPYNQDNETSWIDWTRRDAFADHEAFVQRLLAFRSDHPILWRSEPWGEQVEWYGTTGSPDVAGHSRSLAWHLADPDGPDLYIMVNMWWEQLTFNVQVPGQWHQVIDTAADDGFGQADVASSSVRVEPRSINVLERR